MKGLTSVSGAQPGVGAARGGVQRAATSRFAHPIQLVWECVGTESHRAGFSPLVPIIGRESIHDAASFGAGRVRIFYDAASPPPRSKFVLAIRGARFDSASECIGSLRWRIAESTLTVCGVPRKSRPKALQSFLSFRWSKSRLPHDALGRCLHEDQAYGDRADDAHPRML
jgi:hypothetical protein